MILCTYCFHTSHWYSLTFTVSTVLATCLNIQQHRPAAAKQHTSIAMHTSLHAPNFGPVCVLCFAKGRDQHVISLSCWVDRSWQKCTCMHPFPSHLPTAEAAPCDHVCTELVQCINWQRIHGALHYASAQSICMQVLQQRRPGCSSSGKRFYTTSTVVVDHISLFPVIKLLLCECSSG